jgi:hypothetical protein
LGFGCGFCDPDSGVDCDFGFDSGFFDLGWDFGQDWDSGFFD